MKTNEIRIALASADGQLKALVQESIRDASLPVRIGVDIPASARDLEPEQMERLRSADPHIVVLDMSDDPNRALRAAAAIGSRLPQAALLGVGPQLDATVLLEAMRAGIVEYVPRPVEEAGLYEALGRIMRKRGWAESLDDRHNGKILAFFSPKGGAGSTSVATNVGIELHRQTGKKTLLVDLDLELGEIASLLGVQPRFHFVDLVRNFHRMDADLLASYIESHESGVQVLSAPFEPQLGEEVSAEDIARILKFLRSHYDYVVVDTSKSLAAPSMTTFREADKIFLVTNMDVPSLRNLKRCLPAMDQVTSGDADRIRIVVNRFNAKSLVGLKDLEETLGLDVYATLNNDYKTVIEAISTGRPVVLGSSSRYADQLRELTENILGEFEGVRQTRKSLVERLLSPLRSTSPRLKPELGSARKEASAHG